MSRDRRSLGEVTENQHVPLLPPPNQGSKTDNVCIGFRSFHHMLETSSMESE